MDIVKTLFQYASAWLSMLPLPRKDQYTDMFVNPDSHGKYTATSSIGQGVVDWAIGNVPIIVLSAVSMVIALLLSGSLGSNLTFVVAYVVGGPILSLILSFVFAGLEFLIAKLLGGNGSYGAHFGLTASAMASANLVMLPLYAATVILGNLPLVGCITCLLLPFTLGLTLWALYLRVKSVSAVHSLSTGKAAVAFIASAIAIGVVVAIVYVVLLAAIFSATSMTPYGTDYYY